MPFGYFSSLILVIILVPLASIIPIVILYFVIKLAIKNAMKELKQESSITQKISDDH